MNKTTPTDLSSEIEGFAAAFDCSPHLCVWYDADDRLRWMNKAFERAYKDYLDIVCLGRSFREMMLEVDARREIPEASYDPEWTNGSPIAEIRLVPCCDLFLTDHVIT